MLLGIRHLVGLKEKNCHWHLLSHSRCEKKTHETKQSEHTRSTTHSKTKDNGENKRKRATGRVARSHKRVKKKKRRRINKCKENNYKMWCNVTWKLLSVDQQATHGVCDVFLHISNYMVIRSVSAICDFAINTRFFPLLLPPLLVLLLFKVFAWLATYTYGLNECSRGARALAHLNALKFTVYYSLFQRIHVSHSSYYQLDSFLFAAAAICKWLWKTLNKYYINRMWFPVASSFSSSNFACTLFDLLLFFILYLFSSMCQCVSVLVQYALRPFCTLTLPNLFIRTNRKIDGL